MEGKLLNAFILTAQEAKDLWVPKKIKAIENVEPLEFYREFVARNVPAVIKNQIRWKALDKWTNGYLIDKIKHEITVAETPDGRADAIKDGKFVLPREVKKRIGDFFTELKDKSKVCYIQKQNSSIDLEFQELREDFEELEFGNAIFGRKPEATNIWIGDERSISSLHKDPYENLYVVVSGKKTFTLLPPTDTPFLYKQFYPMGIYDNEFNIKPMKGKVPWIPVDPDEPDYEEYPLFRHASPIKIIVEAGDILYLPSLWYHKVQQQSDHEDRCIAINFWYEMQYDARYTLDFFHNLL